MFLHLSVILFIGTWGWLPSMYHRSHDQGEGVCVRGGGGPPELGKRAVRILPECFLVLNVLAYDFPEYFHCPLGKPLIADFGRLYTHENKWVEFFLFTINLFCNFEKQNRPAWKKRKVEQRAVPCWLLPLQARVRPVNNRPRLHRRHSLRRSCHLLPCESPRTSAALLYWIPGALTAGP